MGLWFYWVTVLKKLPLRTPYLERQPIINVSYGLRLSLFSLGSPLSRCGLKLTDILFP